MRGRVSLPLRRRRRRCPLFTGQSVQDGYHATVSSPADENEEYQAPQNSQLVLYEGHLPSHVQERGCGCLPTQASKNQQRDDISNYLPVDYLRGSCETWCPGNGSLPLSGEAVKALINWHSQRAAGGNTDSKSGVSVTYCRATAVLWRIVYLAQVCSI